jgi:hypothetical protein
MFLRVTDQASREVLANSSFAIDQAILPASLNLPPANSSAAVATRKAIDNPFGSDHLNELNPTGLVNSRITFFELSSTNDPSHQ